MNKMIIRRLLPVLLLTILLIVAFLIRGRSPFGKNQSSFASEPQKEIARIEFSDGQNRLILTSAEGSWLVNGRYEARKSGVMFIIRILTEMKIKSTVSPELFNTEITKKGVFPVKVKVFGKNKLLNSFLVYKTGSNIYGNIMKKNERSKPFIVYVPGIETDIGSGFDLNELFWQPYTVFNLLPSEISSVTLENFAEPTSSFSIIRRKEIFTLLDNNGDLSAWDSTRVNRYISYFTWIPFEKWVLDMDENEKKRIESENPVFRVKVTQNDGKEIILTLWSMTGKERHLIDTDRLWAKKSDQDKLFIIRYFDIDPILKRRSYFFTG